MVHSPPTEAQSFAYRQESCPMIVSTPADKVNSNYNTDDLEQEHLQSSVSVIHLCAYKNEQNAGDDDGNPPTNPSAAFLQLPPNQSIRLDMCCVVLVLSSIMYILRTHV
ncbi:hypothetical protein BDQ94DRAFT_133241 [Aspergillus welwitschiae]|uniref:Uncharacterized protein n=1 Tax=Aspergillus welwitschiae TaxID=1341132 RepID=A0A3F3QK67_9EURO|nr:hypothetical protein BDQ94DRAFT_133241 [Aspergillus welwitschiae]RDH39525.1 hypothetical protein BDQ94DRAFT_133241 [Aspergillus welwitschiae]